MKNKNPKPLLDALLPVAAIIAYVLIGYFFKHGWAVGWLVFLLIPIIKSAVSAYSSKNLSDFSYPVFVTFLFLSIGMIFHIWHPTWVLFITIPAFYTIADSIKRSKKKNSEESGERAEESQAQSPYSQYTYPPKKNNVVPIVVSIIISITAICIVGIIGFFGFLKGSFDFDFDFNFDKNKKSGYTEVSGLTQLDPSQINKIDIEWIDGSVDISYYDGDKIILKEMGGNSQYPMCYKIDNGELKISEYSVSTISNKQSKNLILEIPENFTAYELDIEVVSANVYASGLNAVYFDFETVSGNGEFDFACAPGKMDIESVSGDTKILLPADATGYSVSKNSVSGSFDAPDFDNALRFGDGSVIIEFESVSGSLKIAKATVQEIAA